MTGAGQVYNYVKIQDIIDHLVEVEKTITVDVMTLLDRPMNTNNAFPYSRRINNVYPQWLNGLSNDKPDEFGIDEQYEPITISMQIQVGKVDEGQEGELEQTLFTWIPYTDVAVRANPRLQTPAMSTPPNNLLWTSIRLADALMPGDVIAARFVLTAACFAHNQGR